MSIGGFALMFSMCAALTGYCVCYQCEIKELLSQIFSATEKTTLVIYFLDLMSQYI